MLADTNDPNARPAVDESYLTATGSSDLRVEADHRTAADMVIAAGLNPYRMGLAMMRLMSEWDRSSKPQPMPAKSIEELAASYERVADGPHAGTVQVVRQVREGRRERQEIVYVAALVLALQQAAQWHAHELGLLLQRMKTLPWVRDGLMHWAAAQGWAEDAPHIVGRALKWWLNPTCPVCNGVKLKVIAGTGRTGSKACGKCRGTGEAKLPDDWRARKMIGHIQHCKAEAIHGDGAGKRGLRQMFRHQQR